MLKPSHILVLKLISSTNPLEELTIGIWLYCTSVNVS